MQLASSPLRQRRARWASLSLLVVAGASALAMPACGDGDSPPSSECPGVTEESCPAAVPSYKTDVAPIIEARCQTCHALDNNAGLWSLGDQESVNAWSDTILRQLRSCSQPPPDSGVALALSERQTLEAWLVCGAPDN